MAWLTEKTDRDDFEISATDDKDMKSNEKGGFRAFFNREGQFMSYCFNSTLYVKNPQELNGTDLTCDAFGLDESTPVRKNSSTTLCIIGTDIE